MYNFIKGFFKIAGTQSQPTNNIVTDVVGTSKINNALSGFNNTANSKSLPPITRNDTKSLWAPTGKPVDTKILDSQLKEMPGSTDAYGNRYTFNAADKELGRRRISTRNAPLGWSDRILAGGSQATFGPKINNPRTF